MSFQDFYNLDVSYKNAMILYKTLPNNDQFDFLDVKDLQMFIDDYNKVLDFELIECGDQFPLKQCENSKDLFKLNNEIKECVNELENITKKYNDILNKQFNKNGESTFIKLVNDKESYYLSSTKIRGMSLQKIVKDELEVKFLTNEAQFTNCTIKELSNKLCNLENVFKTNLEEYYIKFQEQIYNKKLFKNLIKFIETVDITYSNIYASRIYGYVKPEIKDDACNIKGVRHPIIERLDKDTEYIPNDIVFDKENGMILYAINSSGKSSLLKSFGLTVIMAQSGLFVPCESMVFTPFNKIISQLDNSDNIWKGQSSFVREMIGLKTMLENSDEHTLCLADELTSSTEQVSATAIFASTILQLVEKKSKFLFTTHLHSVSEIDKIKNNKFIQIKHLKVNVSETGIITFIRKLSDGVCDPLYGLEIAQAVGLPKEFIKMAFELRSTKPKKSRYNTSKKLVECEICSYKPKNSKETPLHAHHIQFQSTADTNNFTKHYHKNSKFNLVSLCHDCHEDVHNNKINIYGYIQTSDGVKLDYNCN
jgi:DNA mismatch repair protein MutS